MTSISKAEVAEVTGSGAEALFFCLMESTTSFMDMPLPVLDPDGGMTGMMDNEGPRVVDITVEVAEPALVAVRLARLTGKDTTVVLDELEAAAEAAEDTMLVLTAEERTALGRDFLAGSPTSTTGVSLVADDFTEVVEVVDTGKALLLATVVEFDVNRLGLRGCELIRWGGRMEVAVELINGLGVGDGTGDEFVTALIVVDLMMTALELPGMLTLAVSTLAAAGPPAPLLPLRLLFTGLTRTRRMLPSPATLTSFTGTILAPGGTLTAGLT